MSTDDRVAALFATWDNDGSPGGAVGVMREGELIYARGFGMANLEHSIPNGPDTVFEIASTSKQFAAACIAMLAAEGKLDLDDDVRSIVPEFPALEAPITIRQLVHHTSGVMDYFAVAMFACLARDDYTKDDKLLAFMSRIKTLNHTPGEAFLYSNTGYFLLSIIVKRVTGKSLREFADERIFAPLQMNSSLFRDDTGMVIKKRAVGYSPRAAGGWGVDESWPDVVGDGGVHTTVEDMARWDANFYENSLEPPDLIDRILERGRTNDGNEIDYAFGLSHGNHRGQHIVSHGGAFAGFRADFVRFPDRGLSVVCLGNAGNLTPTQLAFGIADIYLADVLDPVPEPASESVFEDDPGSVEDFTSVLGAYQSPGGGVVKVLAEDSVIALTAGLSQRFEMVPAGRDRLRTAGGPPEIVLRFAESGSMSVTINGSDQGTWPKVTVDPLTTEQLAAIEGRYRCDDLDVVYEIALADGELKLHKPDGEVIDLEPIGVDTLSAGWFTLACTRSPSGAVEAFEAQVQRSRGLRFVRI